MNSLIRTVLHNQRVFVSPIQLRVIGVASPLSLSSQIRLYAAKQDQHHQQEFQYVPEGKVMIDPVTGNKKLVNFMTINTDLPEHPYAQERKIRFWTFTVFFVCMTIAVTGIFQYEKISCPIMNATMYYLRRSQLAKDHLGDGITYGGLIPYISGKLNTMQGIVDIHTNVEGDNGKATMYLKAGKRFNGEEEKFYIDKWTLVTADGTTLALMNDDDNIILEF
ncbi:hypothetical protein FOA43_003792 [Brettanomyces nanus]|uniref:Uncharacterized protein n=1 Tax=Eeniella nana TaxID=13502 RepID=A0A875S660_EENNA|nr:uncharacterized protein FOA43_003792 [Brettanomyces nanus]QPG76403.1 hypothetical protein FOA43_003792 [Brettanomyces nanus]